MTEDLSFEQILPNWINNERHEVLQNVDVVLLRNNTLVATRQGLTKYPQAFASIDDFIRFNAEAFGNARNLSGDLIRVPREYPELVLKHDIGGEAVNTLLTLLAIGNAVPAETDKYRLQKLPLFWAFDQPDISMIAMGKVSPLSVSNQDAHRKYIEARKRFIEEAQIAGFSVSPLPYQDLLYLGNTETGQPIIALIDEADANILTKLQS